MTALLAPVSRWMPTTKERLLRAIDGGEISVGDAMRAHGLTAEELRSWRTGRKQHGRAGLSVRKLQIVGGRR